MIKKNTSQLKADAWRLAVWGIRLDEGVNVAFPRHIAEKCTRPRAAKREPKVQYERMNHTLTVWISRAWLRIGQ